jgi:hypothetical protein
MPQSEDFAAVMEDMLIIIKGAYSSQARYACTDGVSLEVKEVSQFSKICKQTRKKKLVFPICNAQEDLPNYEIQNT